MAEQRIQLYGSELVPEPSATDSAVDEHVLFIPSGLITQQMLAGYEGYTGEGVRIAIIDTGLTPRTAQFDPEEYELHKVRGLTKRDWHGHGTHVASLIGGDLLESPYGPLQGIAPDAEVVSIKAFNPLGLGNPYHLMNAMQLAVDLDCHIINISSGGKLVVPFDELPEHRFMAEHQERFFVCAAGNRGEEWGVASPGASPYSICVGSTSLTDGDVSHFSARGPNGAYYKNRPDEWEEEYKQYGEDAIKPDVVAPGGGRSVKGERPIEVITSSMSGWYEAFYDKDYDNIGHAQGTSQSAPFVSGLLANLLQAGVITSPGGFKDALMQQGRKDLEMGHGVPTMGMFF